MQNTIVHECIDKELNRNIVYLPNYSTHQLSFLLRILCPIIFTEKYHAAVFAIMKYLIKLQLYYTEYLNIIISAYVVQNVERRGMYNSMVKL